MKKLFLFFIFCFLIFCSSLLNAQAKTVKSIKQRYIKGVNSSKYKDSATVIISYNLDEKTVSFNYPDDPSKSINLKLSFTDKESNAPAIYAETLDKDIAAVLFYENKIEIKYRSGNLSTFSGLSEYDKNKKDQPTKPKTK